MGSRDAPLVPLPDEPVEALHGRQEQRDLTGFGNMYRCPAGIS
jgi:hypothetical protein